MSTIPPMSCDLYHDLVRIQTPCNTSSWSTLPKHRDVSPLSETQINPVCTSIELQIDVYAIIAVYGWRSAEVRNLKNMIRGYHRSPDTTSIADMHLILDFPGTEQILLEQNYRSTGSILAASVAIVSQGIDVSRCCFSCIEFVYIRSKSYPEDFTKYTSNWTTSVFACDTHGRVQVCRSGDQAVNRVFWGDAHLERLRHLT